jgi:hypothetical protein
MSISAQAASHSVLTITRIRLAVGVLWDEPAAPNERRGFLPGHDLDGSDVALAHAQDQVAAMQ